MKKAIVALFLLIPLLGWGGTLQAQPVAACACPDWPVPAQALTQAQQVFSGRVVNIQGFANDAGAHLVTFAVDSVWKGSPGSQVQLIGPPFCDAEFQPGEKYLLYAQAAPATMRQYYGLGAGTYLMSVPCSRTSLWAAAQADLPALGAGRPLPLTGHPSDKPRWIALYIVLMLFGLTLVMLGRQRHAKPKL